MEKVKAIIILIKNGTVMDFNSKDKSAEETVAECISLYHLPKYNGRQTL